MRSMYLLLLVVLVLLDLRTVVFVWLVILTGAAVACINMMDNTSSKARERLYFIVAAIIPIHDQRDMSIA